ncbi:MAG TPA: TIGR02680 family protein [Streptosporangiaceae bacterium]
MTDTRTADAPVTPLPRRPNRYRLRRAGIHQVWQYDQVFTFGDGRLLLRGKNGAGKSKALEMLLPFLLDGDIRRFDAAGGAKTSLKWLMLDGWTGGTNRLGYVWIEFGRTTSDGEEHRLTVGAAVTASTATGEARPVFFATRLAVGEDLPLDDPARRPSIAQLRELIGPDNCYDRGIDYRIRVARELFGLTDPARFRNLVHLLYGLRRPTIGDRIESGELVKVLTEALPPLDDDILDRVARNLDDLDAVRDVLARLEATGAALATFLTAYRGYLHGELRGRVAVVRERLGGLRDRRSAAGRAEYHVSELTREEAEARTSAEGYESAMATAEDDLRAVRASGGYRALGDLKERAATVRAVEGAARVAWSAAVAARGAEDDAAARLDTDVDRASADLTELRARLREARRQARACRMAETLFGEAVTADVQVVQPARTETLHDIDGTAHTVQRPRARGVTAGAVPGLTAWRARLTDVARVVTDRVRAADTLHRLLADVTEAESRLRESEHDVAHAEDAVAAVRDRRAERLAALATAGTAYTASVREWAVRVHALNPDVNVTPLLQVAEPPDPSAAPDGQAPGRDAPSAVREVAHEVVEPVLTAIVAERDALMPRLGEVLAELRAVREEQHTWRGQSDPEPPRPHHATAGRDPSAGAPLYLLIDFAGRLDDTARAGLEAALEAAGLLSAWVGPDGALVDPATRDVVLTPGPPQPGATLAEAVRPVPSDAVDADRVTAVLNGIGYRPAGEDGPAEAGGCWVGDDGRWSLGVTGGTHHKERAEYIGAGARAATRARKLAELAERAARLDVRRDRITAERTALDQRRGALRDALRDLPPARALTAAWHACEETRAEEERLAVAAGQARRDAELARADAVRLRNAALARASSDDLPTDADALRDLRTSLARLRDAHTTLDREIARAAGGVTDVDAARAGWERAHEARIAAERAYSDARADRDRARRELRVLEESVGAEERAVLDRERDAAERRDEARTRLTRARDVLADVHDRRIRAEEARQRAMDDLHAQEQDVVGASGQLRRPLGLPGLAVAADLGDPVEIDDRLAAFDTATDGVRARITALRALADDVEARLGPDDADVTADEIINRGQELRDGLAGGYDAARTQVEGVHRYELHDDSGAHDVAVVGRRIAEAAEQARAQLSAREQEVFERYLLGELGDHLARQVAGAETLVETMNRTLSDVRSSHGIGARLVWELAADADPEVRTAVGLLRGSPAGRPPGAADDTPRVTDLPWLRTREQAAMLRDCLRRRIEAARLADPSAGYASHLRTALDYRAWFSWRIRVTDAHPGRERALNHRTALSQGEQRVVSYLVLFATAAAHFSSLADAAPDAPRLILLDDAFATVDEPTHGRLLGLLVDLDLDFVLTSERLWGAFPTVPSLHIYECLRDPHVRGVATVHYTWDGRAKRLVSV